MSIASHHAEWLSLVPHSGSFLSLGVLKEAFPNGLLTVDTDVVGELRAAYGSWADPEGSDYGEDEWDEVHRAFVLFVLRSVLDLDEEVLAMDRDTLGRFKTEFPIYEAEVMPSAVVSDGDEPLMMVSWVERSTPVDEPMPGDDWSATPRERMAELLREWECPLGLVTDGERWTLVSWREGEPPAFATWWASLWLEERVTLQAFRTLLGEHRFFAVPEEETLPALLDRSAAAQHEVTTKLGEQTLEAVEILIQTIDKLDRERGRRLLADVPEDELYDSAVTVMMRLVFLFFAEENELLPTGEDLYLEEYAASSLRARLQEQADRSGEEVLETRSDAWSRLLAIWRAVFAGVEHGDMRLAPYGGSLFDPDRYPFLEGRLRQSDWKKDDADPLPIDNRTVLHLLNALQTLDEGGHRRKLSFRGLDVEQIGHVYEGMLDHTATRADGWVLGLTGVGGKEPEVPLEELEKFEGDDLVDFLKDRTGRNKGTTRKWLKADMKAEVEKYGLLWGPAFEGDSDAARRVEPFAKFLREDSQGAPAVFPPNSVYVCDSSHREATGTHYTPRALTEEIVRETLEPLVYEGPAEGELEEDWRLRTPEEILELKVADPACGSGAFLVQACRYLAEKLTEARRAHGDLDRDPTEGDLLDARREIAARCLYGVDKNAMAVEMAKLSLWLVTLAADKPFSFVDHALGVGDSLFGLTDLDQLRYWDLAGEGKHQSLFAGVIADELEKAIDLRRQVEAFPVMDHADAEIKAMILEDARSATERLRALADLLFAPYLASESRSEIEEMRNSLLLQATDHLDESAWLKRRARTIDGFVEPFHWALEFPEVFDCGGFDGIVGNPPFMGGRSISTVNGREYREHLVEKIADGNRGAADLCAYFFIRGFGLIREHGSLGLFAVNTISEGDTRQVGLEPLIESGASIYSAHPNEPWPNRAAVVTSRIQIYKGDWLGERHIQGRKVSWISAYLSDRQEYSPEVLKGNNGLAFVGTYVLGSGFLLDDEEARQMIEGEGRLSEVIIPYLNGEDLNRRPDQQPSRWVITFWDWPKNKAQKHSRAFEILRDRVYPERLEKSKSKSYRRIMSMWWKHWNVRPELYHAIGRGGQFQSHPVDWNRSAMPLSQVIVTANVTKYWAPSLIHNEGIFSHMTVIFASSSPAFLALLLSCTHAVWAWKQASSLETRLRYTPSDCFETFPLPEHGELPADDRLNELGSEFHTLRSDLMVRDDIGLTDLYNRFHDCGEEASDLQALRDLQVAIDRRSLELYDWDDIQLEHDFRDVTYLPPNDCRRFAISEEARLELLDRLGRLNLKRFEEEVRAGLHGDDALRKLEKKKAKRAKARARARGESLPSRGSEAPEEIDGQGNLFAESGHTVEGA